MDLLWISKIMPEISYNGSVNTQFCNREHKSPEKWWFAVRLMLWWMCLVDWCSFFRSRTHSSSFLSGFTQSRSQWAPSEIGWSPGPAVEILYYDSVPPGTPNVGHRVFLPDLESIFFDFINLLGSCVMVNHVLNSRIWASKGLEEDNQRLASDLNKEKREIRATKFEEKMVRRIFPRIQNESTFLSPPPWRGYRKDARDNPRCHVLFIFDTWSGGWRMSSKKCARSTGTGTSQQRLTVRCLKMLSQIFDVVSKLETTKKIRSKKSDRERKLFHIHLQSLLLQADDARAAAPCRCLEDKKFEDFETILKLKMHQKWTANLVLALQTARKRRKSTF